ncbi:hypothetical protein [Novosphingobium olei]|uniref:hypothetical protein n=1 Tax=Novosphingobium olei TaxID=2728851 RepID=UPI00308F0522|nr:hypothetical protein NSDW_21500 [Novosphingobium olei]
MDLNHLLFQHQVAVLRASGSNEAGCGSRFDLVRHYQVRIDRLRHHLGASAYPEWCGMPVGDMS